MNSRGTLVRCRIVVETLDSSAAVAMTPKNQPVAAGTQYPRVRVLRRVVVTVAGRQNIPRTAAVGGANPRLSYRTEPVYFSPGPAPGSSGTALASRKARCRLRRPSRIGPACGPGTGRRRRSDRPAR